MDVKRSQWSLLWMIGIGLCTSSLANAKKYPSLPIIYPLQAPPSVSSSFGTYRIGHHHAGLDFYALEGTPVLAAADGWVSQVKRSSSGYGRVVYLKHEGHFQTIYAHLSAFNPSLAKMIEDKAKRKNEFAVKVRPRKKIWVKQGEVLGWSGTSGTDLMHLHFELRYKNHPINPLTHGLKLEDHHPPRLIRLYATPFHPSARIQGSAHAQVYDLNDRPSLPNHPATSLEIPKRLQTLQTSNSNLKSSHSTPKSSPSNLESTPSNSKSSSHQSPSIKKHPLPSSGETSSLPRLTLWGDVRLSLEVEDQIDGSKRGLTPYEIQFEIDGKLKHHLRYADSSYRDRRMSELDYDLPYRFGSERRLVHRLYKIGPRLRQSPRSMTSPLKRLKKGLHLARIRVWDAQRNLSEFKFEILVKKPQPFLKVKAKRVRLKSKRQLQDLTQVIPPTQWTWYTHGWAFPLPLSIKEVEKLDLKKLHIETRINQRRTRKLKIQTTRFKDQVGLAFKLSDALFEDLRKLQKKKKPSPKKTPAKKTIQKSKVKAQKTATQDHPSLSPPKEDDSLDRWIESQDDSIEIWLGIQAIEGSTHLSEPTWYKFKIHHVTDGHHFAVNQLHVRMGQKSTFNCYLTSVHQQNIEDTHPELKAKSPLYQFAQAWTPMKGPNEILIPMQKRKRDRYTDAYLYDDKKGWWVSYQWDKRGIVASSTHLATFALMSDQVPPQIQRPLWHQMKNKQWRLMIPFSDQGSGVSRVKVQLNQEPQILELQKSWNRAFIYFPLTHQPSSAQSEVPLKDPLYTPPLSKGKHILEVMVKDRSGQKSQKRFTLEWPPNQSVSMTPQDLLRLEPTSPLDL